MDKPVQCYDNSCQCGPWSTKKRSSKKIFLWFNFVTEFFSVPLTSHFHKGTILEVTVILFLILNMASYEACSLFFLYWLNDDLANKKPPGSLRRQFKRTDPRLKNAIPRRDFDPRIHFALVCGAKSCPPIRVYRFLSTVWQHYTS